MQYVVDTNVLLRNLDLLEGYDLVIPSYVLRELDTHKKKEGDLGFRARIAQRYIDANEDRITIDVKNYKWTLDEVKTDYVDDFLIQICHDNGYAIITGDMNVKHKAKAFDIPCIYTDEKPSDDNHYKGWKQIEITKDDELASIYEDKSNQFGLLQNEYLIIKHGETYYCHRWNGKSLEPIDVPPKRVVTAQNAQQSCALDLLWNKDIPIKFIIGTYGSGKTFLSVKVALEYVNGSNSRKHNNKLMMVRNPIGSGEAIGFLKGTKEDKTADFFKPLIQHLPRGEYDVQVMEQQGTLLKEIPFYMKGLSIEDTFIIADEAEDLTLKLVKLIGTRLGKGSNVVFSGDFKQAEDKYIYNNGLYLAVDKLKGNPLVGVVYLDEDVRSDASKVFADL